jgi:branched-chain amino acid transport system substrate-binding protein
VHRHLVEQIIIQAQSLDAAKLKEAALKLNDKMVTVTGPYQIDATGKQFKNEFAVMQNMPNGPEVVYPPEVATAKAIYPVPPYKDRK